MEQRLEVKLSEIITDWNISSQSCNPRSAILNQRSFHILSSAERTRSHENRSKNKISFLSFLWFAIIPIPWIYAISIMGKEKYMEEGGRNKSSFAKGVIDRSTSWVTREFEFGKWMYMSRVVAQCSTRPKLWSRQSKPMHYDICRIISLSCTEWTKVAIRIYRTESCMRKTKENRLCNNFLMQ